jgi:methionine-rich copper-binding protein CopC
MMKKQLFLLLIAVLMTCFAGTVWADNVAKVTTSGTDVYYTDFAAARDAWVDGTTLTLLADITTDEYFHYTSGARTLDLNGHGIRYTGEQGVFCIANGAGMTLNDSDPTTTHKFSVDENGFATLDEENGTVTINGGYITGGIGSNTYTRTSSYHDGGAFFIYNGSTVTMNGGTLIGNGEAAGDRTGGAVFIARNGHFIMNGGTITRNRAKYGGGISLYGGRLTADIAEQAPSTLEIHGGEISYNYATGNSGGVHINAYTCAETVYITGGSIINNHVPIGHNAGGIFVEHTNATVYLSGNPVIMDNLSGTVQRNIQLHSTNVLHINGELTNTEPIGITKSDGAGIFTSGLSGNGVATHFSSDIALYTIALHSNGEAKLCTPASCTAPTAIDPTYTGVAQALVNAGTATGGTMMYSLDNDTWDAAVPTAKNAGNYTVYYKVIGDETHADYTPSPNTVAVSIAKAPLTITADEKWIDYGDELMYMVATYTGFVNGEGPGYVQPAVQFSSNYTQGDNAGTYTITPYGAGAANYEISYIEGTLHVNKVYAVITITPTAIDGLVANGSAQTLINAGEATGGEMKYSLNNINWSTDLPTGTDAGDYTVYYRVAGDINHYSTGVASLNVAIAAPSTTIGDPNNAAEVNAFLNYYDGQLVGNLIIDRPVLNNMYNTLCLPFDMDADQIAASSLNGVEIYEFVDATVSNDELYLFTSEEKHEVVAGRPYLVKYSAASQLDDLDFVDVVVNNADLEAQKVVHDGVTFKGTFAPYWMEQQTGLNYEGGYLFLGQNNTLFWPGVSNYVKPFRAYFYVDITTANHNGMPIRRGMPARIGEPHNMPTGVESIQHSDISGQKIMIDGVLYIIRGEHMYDAQGQLVK